MAIEVGQAAGMINAAIVIVQVTAPLFLGFVLLGLVGDENNAVIWSVISRTLQGTLWPTILRSDSTTKRHVPVHVNLASRLGSLVPILLIIAGIVTPLGLSNDGIAAVERSVPFAYAPDTSDFGRASVPKLEYSFNRACGYNTWIPCPGSYVPQVLVPAEGNRTNSSLSYAYANTSIAENITKTFSTGTADRGNTISGVFDIRFRHFSQVQDASGSIDSSRPRTQGALIYGQSFISERRLQAIDGLVIDTLQGGVGFRNHTAPIGVSQTTSWTEDLLWVEPITSCVNLNLSIEFQLDHWGTTVVESFLIDDSGFNSHPLAGARYENPKSQDNPDLFGRALYTAVNGNALLAHHLNISWENSHTGARHKLLLELGRRRLYEQFYGNDPVGDYLRTQPGMIHLSPVMDGWLVNTPVQAEPSRRNSEASARDLADLDRRCGRVGPTESSGIDLLAIHCYLVLTFPRRLDDGDDMMAGPHSVWRHSGFACATTLRATVKEVDFSYMPRGDPGQLALQQLQVTAARMKEYPEGEDVPLWAVEKSGLSALNIDPFWGIVDDDHAHSEAIDTIRRDHLFLPGHYIPTLETDGRLNDGARIGSTAAGLPQYSLHAVKLPGNIAVSDYTGRTSHTLSERWKELSNSTDTVGQIPNLIWTDLFANFAVGTKSQISSRNSAGRTQVTVTVSEARVLYNLLYAIPGIILLLIWTVMGIGAAAMWASSHVDIARLRRILNRVSTGRAVVNVSHPYLCEPDASTKLWVSKAGPVMIDFGVQGQPSPQGASIPPSERSTEMHQASPRTGNGAASAATGHSAVTPTAPVSPL